MMNESLKENLRKIVADRGLSSFGDALVNFLFSLAIVRATGSPKGEKVRNRDLAIAMKAIGLRNILPLRMDSHALGNAAEALIAYGWLKGLFTTEEYVEILGGGIDKPVEALKELLREVLKKLSGNFA
ncbi:MAG: ribonuclease III family protein [Candidatus Bathyarchaeia archaeon]